VIQDFRDKETEKIWKGKGSRRFPADIQRIALRKLTQLSASEALGDLRVPPGNRTGGPTQHPH
jgi:proteic killer suppression protein